MHISKGLIIHHLKNLLPSQFYDLKSTLIIRIEHWKTYNRTWYFYRIPNSSDRSDFDIYIFDFLLFSRTPHTAIVFYNNFLTREVYWYFIISLRSSILYQFNLNCILKALYCQRAPKIQTWLHYTIILKVT